MLRSRSLISGVLLAMVGSILFSGKAIVVKLAYRYGVDAATLIALRMLFAAPVFALVYWWVSRNADSLPMADHLKIGVIGIIGYYGASYLDFLGLQYITAGLERLILYLNPTMVLLISVVCFARRPARRDYYAYLLAYIGIALALWHDFRLDGASLGQGAGPDIGLGVALVFTSAVLYAIYLTGSGELVRRIGAIRLTAHAMLAASAGVAVQFFVVDSGGIWQQATEVYWLSLINALLCTVVPVFATMLAIELIGAGKTSIAAMIGPVSTIFLAFIFLGEGLSIWQAAGTVLVLCGVLLLTQAGSAGST